VLVGSERLGVSRLRSLGGPAVLTGVSQVCSSLGNLLVVVVVSRTSSSADVGAVALALLVYQVTVGCVRALFGEVVLVSGKDPAADGFPRDLLLLSVSVSLTTLLVSLTVEHMSVTPITVLGLFFVPLLAQDTLRVLAFARKRPRDAALGDGGWVLLFVGLSTYIDIANVRLSASAWFGLWSLCGSVAVLVMAPSQLRLRAGQWGEWFRTALPLSRYFLPEYMVGLGTAVLPSLFLLQLASLSELGQLRLAAAFFGPIAIAWVALSNIFVPHSRERALDSLRPEGVMTIGFSLFAVCWLAVAVLIPERLGSAVFGATWAGARQWVPWLGISYVALASSAGAIVGLRVRGGAALSLRARAFGVPLAIGGGAVGYLAGGPAGYGIGLAIANSAVAALAWAALIARQARDGEPA
jgi:hypothetical protein